jgi:zinc protease
MTKRYEHETSLCYSESNKKVIHEGKPELFDSLFEEIKKNQPEIVAFSLVYSSQVFYTIKLIEELRENESGVYGVSARGSMNKMPYGSYNFNIGFPCGPENAEKLIASALTELDKIIKNGPEEKDVNKYKEAEAMEYKKKMKENRYWMTNFTKSFTNGSSPEDILVASENVKAVTAQEIQDVAVKYLSKDKTIGILMPE